MRSETLKPAIAWFTAATLLAAVPTVLVLRAWVAGELPHREGWFVGHNHGPWRWEASGLTVLVAIYGLLVTAVGSFVHGVVSGVRRRSGRDAVPLLANAAISTGLLYAVLLHLFWLID